MYNFYNENPLGKYENDCVIRSLSCATNRSWDDVYNELSDIAQLNGTMMDDRDFVRRYLDVNFQQVPYLPYKVKDVANEYQDNIVLCTMNGHICCIKYGIIYDTFNPGERIAEDAWLVI